jgi:hypothetical protein
MKKLMLTLFVIVIGFAACKKDDDTAAVSYAGSYKGSYTGGDAGSLLVDVDASGNLKGTAVSSMTLEAFGITGKVDPSGKFTGSTAIGTVFIGTFTASSVTGTWSNTSLKLNGSWTGNKE